MTRDESSRPARLAPWLRKRLPADAAALRQIVDGLGLATVCTEAHCPNQGECHARGTATFLIMGRQCTRACRFCAVEKGPPAPLRDDEPAAVAAACERLGLSYVVVTSVTRDDLPDGGASHFARTVAAIRGRLPRTRVEVLTPDFLGVPAHVDIVLDAGPDVFDHNVETVPRLYESIRPRSPAGIAPDYRRSLAVLAHAAGVALSRSTGVPPVSRMGVSPMQRGLEKDALESARAVAPSCCDVSANLRHRRDARETHGQDARATHNAGETPASRERKLFVKSGLMLGMGERDAEIGQTLAELRQAGVDILTLGQYLAPSERHWPVARFVEPAEFTRWESHARDLGFASVLAGPFVRSSYHADELT